MFEAAFELGLQNWPAVLLALVPALLNLAIVIYLFAFAKRNALTVSFGLFVGALTLWQISDTFVRMSKTAETAALWSDFLSMGGLFISPVGLHFALLFTERGRLARSPLVLFLIYSPAVVFETLTRAGFNEAALAPQGIWGWGATLPMPIVNRLMGIWVAGLAIATTILLLRYAWKLQGTDARRKQAFLVAGGFAFPVVQGTVTQVVFPTFLAMEPIPIASTIMSVFSLCTFVALRRHKFLQTPTIEERLQEAQVELRLREQQLSEAQRIAHLGNWEWDLRTNRVTWSDEMYRMYGYPVQGFPVTFEKAMERVVPDDAKRVQDDMKDLMPRAAELFRERGQKEIVAPGLEYRIQLPNGTQRILRGDGNLSLDDSGKPVRMLGVVLDVTEAKRLEHEALTGVERAKEVERLRELDEFRKRFMSTAAHELNTPLTPLYIQLKLLKREGAHLDPTQRAAVDMLDRNVQRLTHLVEELLDSARLEAQRLGVNRQPTNLSELAKEAVDSFQAAAREAGIRLEADLAPNAMVAGDPGRLTQVLFNLLHNAIKFSPRGTITVKTEAGEAEVVLRVRDTGMGLTPDQASRLFQPFTQVHDPGSTVQHGSGLGLYISRGIVELHGGRIWCESPGPDQGSTFSVALPRRVEVSVGEQPDPRAVSARAIPAR